MIPRRWWRRDGAEIRARELYDEIVAQARRLEFYAAIGVPDTLGGRFELVVLHMFLAQRRLHGSAAGARGAGGGRVAQALIEVMFDDMDASLRELGVGDLGVGRRVQAMAEGFYGRAAAFEAALGSGEAELAAALRRNLYGGGDPPAGALAAMARYVRTEALRPALAGAEAGLGFGDPPAA